MNKGDYFKKWIELDEKVNQNPNDESITIFVKGYCYNNIFITNDKKNHRMFMIEFYPQSLNGYKPMNINGINITIKDNTKLDANKKYLVFENSNEKMDDAFIAFSVTVIGSLNNCGTDAETLSQVEQILKDYKNFFAFRKSMDKIGEQGLIAELDYLDRLIDKYGDGVVVNWTGSEKNKHDFIFDDRAVEIKSTLNQEQSIVSISNENQLHVGKLNELKLKLYVFDENSNGKTVDYYIKKIYEKLVSFQSKKLFVSNICMHKIDPFEYKGNYKFDIEMVKSYIIDEKFPRIDKSNIPSEAYDVKYKLNLSNITYEKE